MKQYLELAKTIQERGTVKERARVGLPPTKSLFGYQFRHNLAEGFPILTTKKVSFKSVVYELLWFLRGDTNIKYLVDNGCNIWNEDAYNYYVKMCREQDFDPEEIYSFEDFVTEIKEGVCLLPRPDGYQFGDCGVQYGKLMRNLPTVDSHKNLRNVDQVKDLLRGLKNNPTSRRHILNNWNVGTLHDMALNACHALVQFNCRPLSLSERLKIHPVEGHLSEEDMVKYLDKENAPKYYLDCQLYQRSADVFLGVPFNISSYALLTHIFAKILNMVPGDYIHSFGDAHIYGDHVKQIEEQLTRIPKELPTLEIVDEGNDWAAISNLDFNLIEILDHTDFILHGYESYPSIKGKLSTGLQ